MPVDKFGHFVYIFGKKEKVKCPDLGFQLDDDNHINFNNRRIKNIASPANEKDGVNRGFLKKALDKRSKNITQELESLKIELDASKAALRDFIIKETQEISYRIDGINETIYTMIEQRLSGGFSDEHGPPTKK